MTRVKHAVASHRRHKRVLKRAEGQWGGRHRFVKRAMESVARGMYFSYRDRKQKKRVFRRLWITRINAACRENGLSYSTLIHGLLKAKVAVNRKMLADLAVNDKRVFKKLVETAQAA